MVYLLEKLAVDALVDGPRDAIGIDQEHGDPRVGGEGRPGGEPAGKPDGQPGDGDDADRIGQSGQARPWRESYPSVSDGWRVPRTGPDPRPVSSLSALVAKKLAIQASLDL